MQESTFSSAAELAARLRVFAPAGVAEIMIDFRPNTAATLEIVAEALRLYRAG